MNETSYISCACNCLPNTADWGINNLICYGACNSVAIYDPGYHEIGKVTRTLNGHKERINVVRWLRKSDLTAETELLSASSDGTAIVWTFNGESCVRTSMNDGDTLTIADGIYLKGSTNSFGNEELLICTGSTKGNFTLWHRNSSGSIEKLQILSIGEKIPTAARLSFLPNSEIPLAAIALDDRSVRIYRGEKSQDKILLVQAQILYDHEDWISCMDFTRDEFDNCHLATGSQDSYVRLWKIYHDAQVEDETEMKNETQRRIKRFAAGNKKYAITLESVLGGHEHWVYGVHWRPPKSKGQENRLSLLSCGMDKSMIVWEANLEAGGVWQEIVRVGEVGGNSMGFYGCKYAPDGFGIMAHGYQGSFHFWRYNKETCDWIPKAGPTGHFSAVVDLCWDPKGRFLLSASADQTTRVHAPWTKKSIEIWHEIGRPQVHGYDLSCLAMLGSYAFASGAEEKVVRVFTAPTTFQKYLSTIASTDDWRSKSTEEASVPALGLTNKSVFEENSKNESRTEDLDYERPPTEEELIRHTLWPELQKLYGHGYEIFSMACRSDGDRLATACKSATADQSAIIIWCTKTWSRLQKLSSHRLTVTQMAFSPDNDYLVTVSRDRRFVLHRCNDQGNYEIVATSSKTNPLHSRIIWSCCWTHDSKYFATGSRDGKIGLWSVVDSPNHEYETFAASYEIKNSSVTALAFADRSFSENSYILAIGLDDGRIEVTKIIFSQDKVEWRVCASYDSSVAHHATVRRLAFRPNRSRESKIAQLASCGMDNTLKIHDFPIADFESL